MKNLKKYLFLMLLAIVIGFLPRMAFAVAYPVNPLPFISIGGGAFEFDGSKFSFTTDPVVNSGGYMDGDYFTSTGTYADGSAPIPGTGIGTTDLIYGAGISTTTSLTYNYTDSSDATYNYHYFTGGTLAIIEGATTYLTADFTETVFRQEKGTAVLDLNPFEDIINIRNISLSTGIGSRFIDEFETASLTGYDTNRPLGSEILGSFRISLSVTDGSADFSQGIFSTGTDNGGYVRSAVPEPSSLVLMASGFAGLLGLARNKKKKQ